MSYPGRPPHLAARRPAGRATGSGVIARPPHPGRVIPRRTPGRAATGLMARPAAAARDGRGTVSYPGRPSRDRWRTRVVYRVPGPGPGTCHSPAGRPRPGDVSITRPGHAGLGPGRSYPGRPSRPGAVSYPGRPSPARETCRTPPGRPGPGTCRTPAAHPGPAACHSPAGRPGPGRCHTPAAHPGPAAFRSPAATGRVRAVTRPGRDRAQVRGPAAQHGLGRCHSPAAPGQDPGGHGWRRGRAPGGTPRPGSGP